MVQDRVMLELIHFVRMKPEFHLVKNSVTLFFIIFRYQRVGIYLALKYYFRTISQRVTRSQMKGDIFI